MYFSQVHTYILLNRVKVTHIWRAIRGESSELGTHTSPSLVGIGIVRSVEMGWWRDAGKLS